MGNAFAAVAVVLVGVDVAVTDPNAENAEQAKLNTRKDHFPGLGPWARGGFCNVTAGSAP